MFKYYKLTKVLYPEILIKRRNYFDYYNITLGDLMRRERDTKFKSTTDIWLELRLCNPYVLTNKNGFCVWYSKACFRLCHVPPRCFGTKLYKALDIFCMETDFEFFLVKKYHFKGNGSFEQKDYSWLCDKVFTACQTAPDSERLWNYYQFFYCINFTWSLGLRSLCEE